MTDKYQKIAEIVKQGITNELGYEYIGEKITELLTLEEPNDMTSSHSETEIYNGCISLMWELVGRFYDYLEYLGVEIADDMKFGTTFYPTSIVERLFLWKTSHSGGTSQRLKCKELGIDTREITFDFSEFEDKEDE